MPSLNRKSLDALIAEGLAEYAAQRRRPLRAPPAFSSLAVSSLRAAIKKVKPPKSYRGQSVLKRWPHLLEKDGCHSGLVWPTHDTRRMINWAWLEWHATGSYSAIQKKLQSYIDAVIQVYGFASIKQNLRREFDYFLLQLSVLAGSADLFHKIATCVTVGDVRRRGYQFEQAWCGIVTAMMVNNDVLARSQFSILERYKPTRMWAWPSLKLTQSLVALDWRAFSKSFADEMKACHGWAVEMQAFDSSGHLLPDKLDSHFTWPHPSAVMAVAAALRGWKYEDSSVWLPREFLESIVVAWGA